MKKLYSLLTLIVCLLCSVGAKATVNAPLLSTDETLHEYYVRIAAPNDNDYCYLSVATSSTETEQALGGMKMSNTNYTKLKLVFKLSSTFGYYNIYVTSITSGSLMPIVVESGKAYIKAAGTTPTNFSLTDFTNGFAIYPQGSSTGLRYNNTSDTPYPVTSDASGMSSGTKWKIWIFEPVEDLTDDQVTAGNNAYANIKNLSSLQSAYSTYKTALENASGSYGTLGYPTSDAVSTFTTAADALIMISNPTAETLGACNFSTTYNSLISTLLSSVTMPESGKVYKIMAVFTDGTKWPLYWDATGTYYKNSSSTGGTDGRLSGIDGGTTGETTNTSAYFFCRALDNGTYMFVNKDGKYLSWLDPYSSDGKATNNRGATDAYDTESTAYNDWTIEPADLTIGSGSLQSGTTMADFIGRLQMKGKAGDGNSYYLNPRKPGDNSSTFDFVSSSVGNKYYDLSSSKYRTYTFEFEEVTDYTPMVFAAKGEGYATYSTPFPVEIPSNVKAYTATTVGTDEVTLTALSTSYIPEGTGVLVKYTGDLGSGQKIIPVPAAVTNSEAGTVSGNQFVATGGDAATVESTTTAYILGVVSNELGFYTLNSSDRTIAAFRAYLTGTSSTNGLKLNFNDEATGINAAEINAGESAAPVYDLSGRRVTKATRGLYIQGGKKFIAK